MARCKGKTKAGAACKASCVRGSAYCLFHNKGKSVNYMKSRKMRSEQARRK